MTNRHPLREYQLEIGRAVMDSATRGKGLTFTVEIARQGGKNELSAQMATLLLTMNMVRGGNMIKAAPTFLPQALISMNRLKERLDDAGYGGFWRTESGQNVVLGKARQMFLSAEPHSNVVGNTAHILLEMDEAQSIDSDKYHKEFRPMGASTNVTTVLYGTPWDGRSLLEEVAEANLELERKGRREAPLLRALGGGGTAQPALPTLCGVGAGAHGREPSPVSNPVLAAARVGTGRAFHSRRHEPASGKPSPPSRAGPEQPSMWPGWTWAGVPTKHQRRGAGQTQPSSPSASWISPPSTPSSGTRPSAWWSTTSGRGSPITPSTPGWWTCSRTCGAVAGWPWTPRAWAKELPACSPRPSAPAR